ncbi:zonular occludens toxin domain-containing protein [Halopseudomonas sp.]|uniref:zonular occludens toxin domain-containing protein n=1 Tax=Halopseudomonas sp. TaxID=2901191 RepID=UPI003002D7BD
MAIKIHHGPNGSYKTSGAIQDDLIPALMAGRHIITNIRGLTRERVFQVFPDLPSSVEVENLDLEDLDDLEKMRTFPQWAPRGAFIIFDETQLIFLKSWRETDLRKFDFPGGSKAAKEADRPINWLDGWTRHRHWNWDIILTTPNIGYIRDDIRLTAEKAYLHSNLAVIGIKGRYKESQHAATDNKPPMKGSLVSVKKINKRTFKLYDSTATGTVSDTIAGKSLFRDPKVLLLLALPAIVFGNFLLGDGFSFSQRSTDTAADQRSMADRSSAAGDGGSLHSRPPGGPSTVPVSRQQNYQSAGLEHPFQGHTIAIKAALLGSKHGLRLYLFDVISQSGERFQVNSRQILQSGYTLSEAADCSVRLTFKQWSSYAVCTGVAQRTAERLVSERSSAPSSAPEKRYVTVVAETPHDVPVTRHINRTND